MLKDVDIGGVGHGKDIRKAQNFLEEALERQGILEGPV